MKVVVQEVEGEGLQSLLGKIVTLYCGIYIYTGKLVGVNASDVKLEDAGVVYETGPYTSKDWKDCQRIPGGTWYVRTAAIESYGVLK